MEQKRRIYLMSINKEGKKVNCREIQRIIFKENYEPILKYEPRLEQDLLKRFKEDRVVWVMVDNGVITDIGDC